MRIMTSGALSILDRRMDILGGKFFVMAFVAKLSNVLDRLEFVGGGLLVTESAIAGAYRTMNEFLFAHVGVALGGYTGIFFAGGARRSRGRRCRRRR